MTRRELDEKWFLGSDVKLDADGDIDVDSTGDIAVIEAEDCLVANLQDRLFTCRGGVLLHPDFGAGVPDWVGERMDENRIADLKVYVKQQVLEDPRVAEVLQVDVIEPTSDIGTAARRYELRVSVRTVSNQVVANMVFPFEIQDLLGEE